MVAIFGLSQTLAHIFQLLVATITLVQYYHKSFFDLLDEHLTQLRVQGYAVQGVSYIVDKLANVFNFAIFHFVLTSARCFYGSE